MVRGQVVDTLLDTFAVLGHIQPLTAFAECNIAAGRDEIREIELQERAWIVPAVLHVWRKLLGDLGQLLRGGSGEPVRKTEFREGLVSRVLLNELREAANIVGDSLQVGRFDVALQSLQLQPLDLADESL